MFYLLCLGLTAAATAALYRLTRSRTSKLEACGLVRCSSCGQKVRYGAHQAGATGVCPRCFKPLTLPVTPQPLPKPHRPHRIGQRLAS